jgi:hypothetical protein
LHGRSGENVSYYCNFCSVETNPQEKELRSKPRIEPHEGGNKVPLVSTKFTEPTVGRKKKELTGSFKVLRERGMKFTNITESKG